MLQTSLSQLIIEQLIISELIKAPRGNIRSIKKMAMTIPVTTCGMLIVIAYGKAQHGNAKRKG